MTYPARTDSARDGHVCPALTPVQIARGLKSGRYVMSEIGLERLCGRCNEYYPADTEFWGWMPSDSTGLHAYCRACRDDYRMAGGPSKRRYTRKLVGDLADGVMA